MNDTRTSFASDSRRFRWPAGIVLLLIPCGVLVALLTTDLLITGKPSRDVIGTIFFAEIGFYVWVRVFSGGALRTQVAVIAACIAVQAAIYGCVRLEGFSGSGRLILAWRWTPTADELYRRSRAERSKEESPPVSSVPAMRPLDDPRDWPGFRGADRMGVAAQINVEPDWKATPPKLLWRRPVGPGWSSFAISGGLAVTQEQRDEFESVVCYELLMGREVWVHQDAARFDEVTGGSGPRATPTIHVGRVYSLGATGILNCLEESTGELIWSTNILEDHGKENCLFGMAGSPLIVGDRVVVAPGGRESSLAAYESKDGALVWSQGDADASYRSPQLADLSGHLTILNFNADGLAAHDVADGRVLFSFPWVSNPAEPNNVCQPIAFPPTAVDSRAADTATAGRTERFTSNSPGSNRRESAPPDSAVDREAGRIFISSGYNRGCAMLRVVVSNDRYRADPIWSTRNLRSKFSSVVERGGFAYELDERILVCIDLATGERCWRGGRYGHGQLIRAGDHLIVQAESGDMAIVAASPDSFRELGRTRALHDRTWNHPALAGPWLLVRNDREAACYELPMRSRIAPAKASGG